MVTYVFDASALLRFMDAEAGADRVETILRSAKKDQSILQISAVNWGEILSALLKRRGPEQAEIALQRLRKVYISIIPASSIRAERAALIKHRYRIPYADAFGVELASDSRDHVLITADFDVKPAANDIAIEFLPAKSKA